MKKVFFALLVLGMFALGIGSVEVSAESTEEYVLVSICISYGPFEEDVTAVATHLVIAQYISHEPAPAGQRSTVFKFEVIENIVGSATDRIFVYMPALEWVEHSDGTIEFDSPRNFVLTPETDYLLVLRQGALTAYSINREFSFIQSTVIDLDTPENSIPHGSLPWILTGLNFNTDGNLREDIISHVTGLMRDNPPRANNVIMSEAIEDIVLESPYVLMVEINEPISLDRRTPVWMSTSIYYATVVEILAGREGLAVGDKIDVTFFANTVSTGEQHIIAISRWHDWFEFTSPHSLLSVDQLDEIKEILADTVQVTEQLPTQPPTSLPPIPPPPPPGSPLPSSSTPYIPWQPHPSHAQLPTPPTGDPAYLVYGNDPSTDAPENILIFAVGNTQYLLNDQIRTAVGTPFIDPATDRMMIPLRTLSEALGVNVEWDSANRAALVHLPTGTLAIPANDMLPDGMGSVIIVNDRIFVPLRFVMYAYDADVEWDSVGRAAVITW